jgi:hypothetical protein
MTEETGPWDAALAQLRQWDPAWAETCTRMVTNPWHSGALPRKLVGIALNAACTSLNPEGTRRHIRRALDAVKAIGQWNAAWDPFVELDPAWTDQFMATGGGIYASGQLSAKGSSC